MKNLVREQFERDNHVQFANKVVTSGDNNIIIPLY